MKLKKTFKWIGVALATIGIALLAFLWFGIYHPADIEKIEVACAESAPKLRAGQTLKVLTWNVQSMSGKNYVFWSDLPNNDGPDEKPTPEDVALTFEETIRVIKDENPDIILIQELENGAERTGYEDQFARLLTLLPEEYKCSAAAFDWKAAYVPHPRIRGSVGWMVAIVSKYKITDAERYQLATAKKDWLTEQFSIKPAVLAAHLPIESGGEFIAATLHFDIYVKGSDAKDLQVKQVKDLISQWDKQKMPWILGGDFNLLPYDDAAYARLLDSHKPSYNAKSEIKPLFDSYQAVPSTAEITGADFAKWLTRFPNDPAISGPDRTLDYFFFPNNITIGEHYVRQSDTLKISDHLPVIVNFQLP